MKGKPSFTTINAKEDIAHKISIISSVEQIKIYELIEIAFKETFPEYFGPDEGVLEMVETSLI